jgi:hypothetical protein
VAKFRLDTSGYSSNELIIYKDGCFCKSVLFGDELVKAGFSWDYSAFMMPEPIFSDSSKKIIKERVNVEVSKYAEDNKISTYTIDYPWESIEVTIKCECGSEKVGSTRHSHWCPKYKESK